MPMMPMNTPVIMRVRFLVKLTAARTLSMLKTRSMISMDSTVVQNEGDDLISPSGGLGERLLMPI